jgi:hypothetical protein
MSEGDDIPVVDVYRGVSIHDRQPRERIEGIVKPSIDAVIYMADARSLAAYAGDVGNPPEARLLAAAKCAALMQLAAERREVRPVIDMERLRATVAGLGSRRWRSPYFFGSTLESRYLRSSDPAERARPVRRAPADTAAMLAEREAERDAWRAARGWTNEPA